MPKVFGIVKVIIDDIDYRTKPGWYLDLGGFTKTSQYASGIRSGTTDEPVGSKAGGAVEIMTDTDFERLRNFDGGTVKFVTDVDQIYAMPAASLMTPPKLQDGGRGAELEFEGDSASKVA